MASTEPQAFIGAGNGTEPCVELYGTITSGLETTLAEELSERFKGLVTCITRQRGRVYFKMPIAQVHQALHLRLVDHLCVVVAYLPECLPEDGTAQEFIEIIRSLPPQIEWTKAISVWERFHTTKILGASGDSVPSFRVTGNRVGENHPKGFESVKAAGALGAGVISLFGWRVNLNHPDIDVHLNIVDRQVWVSLRLTKDGLYKRNVTAFGPTTLRATICYALLRQAALTPGEIVVDPMCGVGSISLEGSVAFPDTYQLMGDNHQLGLERCTVNMISLIEKEKTMGAVDAVRWDVTSLPLRNGCVDVFVTDLPFGMKMGRRKDNHTVYLGALKEMSRVCVDNGRAVVMTQDKRTLIRSLDDCRQWKTTRELNINLGGLRVGVFVLRKIKRPPPTSAIKHNPTPNVVCDALTSP